MIASDIGPTNNYPFVAGFERHVKLLRDTMYEATTNLLFRQRGRPCDVRIYLAADAD